MKKIIFSHPTGNANARAALDGLYQSGQLHAFYTTIANYPGNLVNRLSKVGPLAELARRSYTPVLAPLTHSYPFYEAGRMIASKLGWKKMIKHEQGLFSVDSVYSHLDEKIAGQLSNAKKNGVDAVYAYEDGALASFKMAKQAGLTCLYDQPIGYWRAMHRLLKDEQTLHPEWAATLTGFHDSEAKLAHKDDELRLADHIFAASSFTASTLKDFPGKLAPVSVIPYGFPTPNLTRTYQPLRNRPLKILFVGGLSQRKGIAYLFEAVETFGKSVELTVVGGKSAHGCQALDDALSKHRWIPSLPHADILKLMQEQDVFIFPSLFEGFGLVITEAMSQGTPVITTERTAGPDLIQHNENGWLVPAGDTTALKQEIENLLLNPAQLKQNGMLAIESAIQRPWVVYGRELSEDIEKLSSTC